MNAQDIKQYILENEKVEFILEEIGCQFVKWHNSGYWTCSNPPPSDNKTAITIYSPSLNCVNYTKEMPLPSDIITLIQFVKEINFFHALKYLHEILEIDFYKDQDEDLPHSLVLTKMMKKLKKGEHVSEEDDTPIKPIPESVLKYYKTPCVNDMFLRDGIGYDVQSEFQIGYCEESNRITIPIYDEINNLVSVKGRLFKEKIEEDELKYIYLYKCPRNKILFALNKSLPYIQQSGRVYVGEAEKFNLQLWSYGYKNCISLGGKKISKVQIDKLIRLNAEIVLCLDADVKHKELEDIASRFIDGVSVWAMFDREGILGEKESPSDKKEKWEYLVKNCIEKIK
jgi:DNA primase